MKRAIGVLIVVAIVAAGGAAGMAWTRLQTPYKGYTATEQFVEIPTGAGAADIRQRLLASGVVRDGLTLRLAMRWTGASRALKAGEYRFDRPMTAVEVVQKIARGDVYGQRITFPEGLTIREMAGIYESHGLGRARDFIAASRNTALIQDLDPAASDLEGYLFPDTYTVGRTVMASDLIGKMVAGFRAAFPATSPAPGDQPALSPRQLVTLASLINERHVLLSAFFQFSCSILAANTVCQRMWLIVLAAQAVYLWISGFLGSFRYGSLTALPRSSRM